MPNCDITGTSLYWNPLQIEGRTLVRYTPFSRKFGAGLKVLGAVALGLSLLIFSAVLAGNAWRELQLAGLVLSLLSVLAVFIERWHASVYFAPTPRRRKMRALFLRSLFAFPVAYGAWIAGSWQTVAAIMALLLLWTVIYAICMRIWMSRFRRQLLTGQRTAQIGE